MAAATAAATTATTPTPAWTAVKSVGVFADRNARHRRKMEDAHVAIDKFAGVDTNAFFAIYDGHMGRAAADYCATHLHKELETHLASFTPEHFSVEEMTKIWTTVYKKVDTDMKATVENGGACVITALVTKSGDKRYLITANAGDSQGMLSHGGVAKMLSYAHTVDAPDEAERIQAAGGFIINGRLNGMIAITRSLGDHNMKEWVIADPYVTVTELSDSDSFIILACDGVWDVISDQGAVDLVKAEEDPTLMAKRIGVKAIQDGSTDNISVIVIRL